MENFLFSSTISFAQGCGRLLHGCMKAKALKPCKQIHALTIIKNADMNYWSLSSKVIGAYACCGDLLSSELVFRESPNPNIFALNWIILGLNFSGFHEEAIRYFSLSRQSRDGNCYPNRHTLSAVLKCCASMLDLVLGSQVHGLIYKIEFVDDVLVSNGLIDMYGKCRMVDTARQVFDRMSERDVASWTSLIRGYADEGNVDEAIALFNRMSSEGIEPNKFTWSIVIAMHARIGDCVGASELFSQMMNAGLAPDIATWNSVISGFVKGQRAAEAFEFLNHMIISGFKADEVTLTGLLPACVQLASISRGKELHCLICRLGIEINTFVSTALIDMYSKCGCIEQARKVFASAQNKNVPSWNAMIGCYAKHGMVDSAIQLSEKMQEEGLQPNEVTLTSILCACSHGGLAEKGGKIFGLMCSQYHIKTSNEHYSCLVDLLCRRGRMEEAYDVVNKIGIKASDSTVGAFLNGCKIHGRRDLAEKLC